ncbi:MAG: hypothetical protein K0S04_3495 [Herbinix sp.]|jgi:hypothetical protein|nr:hypothetical protein [Herbinix sp.]
MEEKVHIFDGENFKSAGVQIVEHLEKEVAHISATKNPLKIKGFRKRETGFEFYPLAKILIERDFPAHPMLTYSSGYSIYYSTIESLSSIYSKISPG